MINTGVKENIESHLESQVNRGLRSRLAGLRDELLRLYPEKQDIITSVITSHSYPVKIALRFDYEKKDRTRKNISDEVRCQARTGSGSQCRRPMAAEAVFCMSHKQKLPHGSIHDKLPPKIQTKRGRKKCKGIFKTEDLDPSLYRQAALIEIDNTPYLVDENHIIYKFGENIIVGHINADSEVLWA